MKTLPTFFWSKSVGVKMLALHLVGLVIFGPTIAVTANLNVELKKNKLFSELRRELLNDGWNPVESQEKMWDDTELNQFGEAGVFYQNGYIEVEVCSEGKVFCIFNYRRRNECLQITTKGEYVKGSSPVLEKWSKLCYNKNSNFQ